MIDLRRNQSWSGLSLYVCIGWYGGIRIRRDGPSIILTIGFVSVGLVFRDLERMIAMTVGEAMESRRVIDRAIDEVSALTPTRKG